MRVFSEKTKRNTDLLKCANDYRNQNICNPGTGGQIDPAIDTELKLILEAHSLLDVFAERIWPKWNNYKSLEFFVTFPNRDVLVLTQKEKMPHDYLVLSVHNKYGKKVYLNRTKERSGRIGLPLSIQGHSGIGWVNATLIGPINTNYPIMLKKPMSMTKLVESGKGMMLLYRLLTYVHEAFHCLQAQLRIDGEKTRARMNCWRDMNKEFDSNLEYSVFAEIEGCALLSAFHESNNSKALEYLKDSLVAREIRQRAMTPGAVVADIYRTRDEGTATYANIRLAMLLKDAGYQNRVSKDDNSCFLAFEHLDEYLKKEIASCQKEFISGTLDTTRNIYIHGALQCFLLDRLFPDWKTGLFENDRSLDKVISGFLNLTEGEKQRIEIRLKTDFTFNNIRAKHAKAIQKRNGTIQSIMKREGKKYMIDLRQAQREVDISPRQYIHYEKQQLYPLGLSRFFYGSLKLVSQDTPMRLFNQYLEWVDTEAKPGKKSYNLRYEEKVGDLYKNVTLTTRGFSMTAAGIRIVDRRNTVMIFVID